MNTYINVFSTLSTDKLLNKKGEVFAVQAGGPSLFIEQALKDTRVQYKINRGHKIDVEILITSADEYGRVSTKPSMQIINNSSEWTIVSSILDEWQLSKPLPNKLFVDLQGYTRNGKNFGKKQSCQTIDYLAGKIFCLKGTREEVSYLSKSALKRQQQRLLLVTDGSNNVELFSNGNSISLPVNKIDGLADTIGAGDSFLAYFVASMFCGANPAKAAQQAIYQTGIFLKTKPKNERRL